MDTYERVCKILELADRYGQLASVVLYYGACKSDGMDDLEALEHAMFSEGLCTSEIDEN